MNDPADRFELVFDMGEADRLETSFGEELPEDTTAELQLVLPERNTVREQLRVPGSLDGQEADSLVQLS